jgi:hypothetical protein
MESPLFFALALLAAIFTRFVPKPWKIARLVMTSGAIANLHG